MVNSSMRLIITTTSFLKRAKKSLSDSEDRWRTVIRDAVIFPSFLLLENLVRNLFLSMFQESMERGGKFLNHSRVVPLRQVHKKRHHDFSECPK